MDRSSFARVKLAIDFIQKSDKNILLLYCKFSIKGKGGSSVDQKDI